MNHVGLILVLAWLGGSGLGRAAAPSPSQDREGDEMRRVRVDLSSLSSMITARAFHHTNPPPWPKGNHLSLSSKTNAASGLPPGWWSLVNMHAENYAQIIRRRNFRTLEFGLLPDHRCMVVDSRVPRQWFLVEPLITQPEQRLSLKSRFARFFRQNPAADALVGTRWVLVSREDPGRLTERVLPGEKVRFGATNLTCEAASGAVRGQRLWELMESPLSLRVCEIQSAQEYTGALFKLTRTGDELVLVPAARLTGSATGYGSELYGSPAKLTYRRERQGIGNSEDAK
jgi:hypothetical protein